MESLQGPESYSGHHCIGQLASKQLERPSTSEATLSSQLKLACHIRPPCGQKLCPACKQVRRPADSLRPNPTTNPKKPRRRHKCHSGKHAFAHRWPPPCPKKSPGGATRRRRGKPHSNQLLPRLGAPLLAVLVRYTAGADGVLHLAVKFFARKRGIRRLRHELRADFPAFAFVENHQVSVGAFRNRTLV